VRTLSPPWRRVLAGSWVVILVLGVATLILYVDNKRTRECISTYMVTDQQAATARSALADEERQFFKRTLKTLVTDPDRDVRLKAINDYIALLDKDDQIRKENPVPKVPTECD